MNWHRFWDDHPRRFAETDFMRQVARTANGGRPTSAAELAVAIAEAAARLELGTSDRLLDLCCGNGALTRELAARADTAVGVDFSAPMLDVARVHFAAPGLEYVSGSVLELRGLLGDPPAEPFTKVCMAESLHYFHEAQLGPLLDEIVAVSGPRVVVLFTGVLDASRKRRFYDTPLRWEEHQRRSAEGTDVMGQWWSAGFLREAAAARGLSTEVLPQDPSLNTAHYRFDVRLRRLPVPHPSGARG